MKKVKIFKSTHDLEELQKEIDRFVCDKELIDTSLTTTNMYGVIYYSILLIYKQ